MNFLLPKNRDEFQHKDYWNNFFEKRGKKAFEWYGEYPQLCGHVHKYIKPKDNILVIGCGNSKLSADMYDAGCQQITNIDISKVVIRQMCAINKERTNMKFIQMDVTQLTFPDDEFTVVLDKGTLDALMPDDGIETCAMVTEMFKQIRRVLRIGGRYICISLLQEHILKHIIDTFTVSGWMFRIVRCFEAEQNTTAAGALAMPVFIVICTKVKPMPVKIFEICINGEKIDRLTNTDDIVNDIKLIQRTAMVCNGLTRSKISESNEIVLDLCQIGSGTPRFTIHVLDNKKSRTSTRFAAFIVPQGRETEWLFSTPEGRKQLLDTAGYDRLAVVSLHRGEVYGNLEAINAELAISLKNLAPNGHTGNIPYLSVGSDSGKREIRFEDNSNFCGKYVVEDVYNQVNEVFRRLIFLSNQSLVQSEAKLKKVKGKNGKDKFVVDIGHLACEHHTYMIAGVELVKSSVGPVKVMVLGLGGGGLCSFLQKCIETANITAVDIDPAMLKVATQWFGLTRNERLNVEICDGLEFIAKEKEAGNKYDAILFDVNSNDSSLGMSCPPKTFLQLSTLGDVKSILDNQAVFIINLVCRDADIRRSVFDSLAKTFTSVASYKLEEDQNEIIFCSDHKYAWVEEFHKATESVNALARKHKLVTKDLIDVRDFTDKIQIKC